MTDAVKLPPGATLVKSPTMNAAPSAPSASPNIKLPQGATLTKSSVPNAAQGAAVPASPPAAAPAPLPNSASAGINRSGSQMGVPKVTFDDFMKDAEAWARGASFGTSDDASAGLAAAILKAKGDPRAMGEIYKQLDAVENQRADEGGIVPEIAGMVTGPGVMKLGQFIGRGANWLARAGRAALGGAGAGAVGGAGYAKPGEKEAGAVLGGATGAILSPIMQVGGEALAPKISAATQRLLAKGITPPPGQAVGGTAASAEEKLSSLPIVGGLIKEQQAAAVHDFNRAVYQEVVAPLGIKLKSTVPIGNEGFDFVDDLIGSRYDALLPKMTFVADSQFQSDIKAVDMMADALPGPQREKYIKLMNAQFADKISGPPAAATMDGTTFKTAQSVLKDQIRRLQKGTVDEQDLAQVLMKAEQTMRNALGRANPQYATELGRINQSYMMLTRAQRATSYLGAKDGIFSPSQFMGALKAKSGEKQFARGTAPMQALARDASSVLSKTVPNSGTFDRFAMAHLLNPKVLATAAGTSIPYLLPRGYYAQPWAQDLGRLLMQAAPRAGAASGPAADAMTGLSRDR